MARQQQRRRSLRLLKVQQQPENLHTFKCNLCDGVIHHQSSEILLKSKVRYHFEENHHLHPYPPEYTRHQPWNGTDARALFESINDGNFDWSGLSFDGSPNPFEAAPDLWFDGFHSLLSDETSEVAKIASFVRVYPLRPSDRQDLLVDLIFAHFNVHMTPPVMRVPNKPVVTHASLEAVVATHQDNLPSGKTLLILAREYLVGRPTDIPEDLEAGVEKFVFHMQQAQAYKDAMSTEVALLRSQLAESRREQNTSALEIGNVRQLLEEGNNKIAELKMEVEAHRKSAENVQLGFEEEREDYKSQIASLCRKLETAAAELERQGGMIGRLFMRSVAKGVTKEECIV
jgi:hypothetical protein